MIILEIRPLWVVNIILIAILLYMGGNELYLRWVAKKSATYLNEEDFKTGMHKAQVIDLREKDEFRAGHILGARNMPYSIFKSMMPSIRKDMPVYLYDSKKTFSIRAANMLRKNGYQDIYILRDGFRNWTGKTKRD